MLKLRHRKWFAVAVFVILLAGALVYGFMPQAVPVETALAGKSTLRVTVREEGKTRVVDRYTVSTPVSGYLRRISLDEGDMVDKGSVLAVLEPLRSDVLDPRARAEARSRVSSARSSVEKAEADAARILAEAEYAGSDLARKRVLFERGIIARDELESAESASRGLNAALNSAKFAADVARHELETARTALEYSAAHDTGRPAETVSLRSPVAGRVLRVLRISEGTVTAGEQLIEIGDPAALEVEVDLLSDDAVRVGPGTRVLLERWGGEDTLEARVRVVEPSGFTKVSALGVEEQRVFVISDIVSPPEIWERLGDGYKVDMSFIIWEGADVLQVPESALFRHGEGWAVFLVDDGRASLRQVLPGMRNGLSSEIASGISEGDTVVIHPGRNVEDGVKVRKWEE